MDTTDTQALFYTFSTAAQVLAALLAFVGIFIIFYFQYSVDRFKSIAYKFHHLINNHEDLDFIEGDDDWKRILSTNDFAITKKLRNFRAGGSEEQILESTNDILKKAKLQFPAADLSLPESTNDSLQRIIQTRIDLRSRFIFLLGYGLPITIANIAGIAFAKDLALCSLTFWVVIGINFLLVSWVVFLLYRLVKESLSHLMEDSKESKS